MLEGKILGIPVILIVLWLFIITPIVLVMSFYIYLVNARLMRIESNTMINARVVNVTPVPLPTTATTAATITPTQATQMVPVRPNSLR